jgi:hypothetical protein
MISHAMMSMFSHTPPRLTAKLNTNRLFVSSYWNNCHPPAVGRTRLTCVQPLRHRRFASKSQRGHKLVFLYIAGLSRMHGNLESRAIYTPYSGYSMQSCPINKHLSELNLQSVISKFMYFISDRRCINFVSSVTSSLITGRYR